MLVTFVSIVPCDEPVWSFVLKMVGRYVYGSRNNVENGSLLD